MVDVFREFLPIFLERGMDAVAMAWLDGYREGRNGHRKEEDKIVEAGIAKALNDARLTKDRILNLLEKIRSGAAAGVKVVWEGFGQFSRAELHLEPEALLTAWFPPALAELREFQPLLDGVQADLVSVEAYRKTLADGWKRFVSEGT